MSGIDRGQVAQMGRNRRLIRPPNMEQRAVMTALDSALRELGFGEQSDGCLVYGASFSPSGELSPFHRLIVDIFYSELGDFLVYAQMVWLRQDARMGTLTATLECRTDSDAGHAIEQAGVSIVGVLRDLQAGTGVASIEQEA